MNLRMFIAALGQAGAPALAVDIQPRNIDTSGGNIELTVGDLSAAATGGVPPYTYRWFRDSGSTKVYIEAGDSAAQQATIQSSATDEATFARFKVTVTDAVTTSAESTVSARAGATHGTIP